jgi:RNA recognition motif-containing protein
VTQDELQALFAEVGEVVSVTVPTDRDSGRPRGFAFIEMSTAEQAATALEKFNGYTLSGRALRVNEATEKPSGTLSSRPGGFGGFDRAPRRSRPKGSRRNVRARKRSL